MGYINENNTKLSFKVYDKSMDTYIEIYETLSFSVDMHLGNGNNPVEMNLISESPQAYNVGIPYPNPFNPIVNFDIELNSQAYVQAKIYNIKGEKVATLHDGILSKDVHKMSWTANSYASGIYFINVIIDDKPSIHKKIILLK